jgi:hypothetical protein
MPIVLREQFFATVTAQITSFTIFRLVFEDLLPVSILALLRIFDSFDPDSNPNLINPDPDSDPHVFVTKY